MFRCESCGSGYSAQAASSWDACPRCLAKEGTKVPLSFELGWRRADDARGLDKEGGRQRPAGPAGDRATVAG